MGTNLQVQEGAGGHEVLQGEGEGASDLQKYREVEVPWPAAGGCRVRAPDHGWKIGENKSGKA